MTKYFFIRKQRYTFASSNNNNLKQNIMETKLTLSDVLLITVYWVIFFTILFFIL